MSMIQASVFLTRDWSQRSHNVFKMHCGRVLGQTEAYEAESVQILFWDSLGEGTVFRDLKVLGEFGPTAI